MFLLLLSTGYLFAMVLLYTTVSPLDGRPGLSPEDIKIKYFGSRTGTRLENALNGVMKNYHSKEEHDVLIAWIHGGAGKKQFEAKVLPIIKNTCMKCHVKGSEGPAPDIADFDKITPYVQMDTGDSVVTLVRVSHIHLFGLGLIFFLIGRIFLLAEIPVWLKSVMVIIPFFAIGIDIGSWWFTRYSPDIFAYSVILGGGLMGISFAFQVVISLYQMWFYKPKAGSSLERGGERSGERRKL